MSKDKSVIYFGGNQVSEVDVVIGTTIVRKTAYAFDRFMKNQKEIQEAYPQSRLVLATDEPDFEGELKEFLKAHRVEGEVIIYKTEKPDYARAALWSLTCGREAIRKYALNTDIHYLLTLDADMTYDPLVINILKKELEGFDVVQSGYRFRLKELKAFGFGPGCSFFKREIIEKLKYDCYEFNDGRMIIDEGLVLERDLFRLRARIRKGIFVKIEHYYTSDESIPTEPRSLTLFERKRLHPLFRFTLITLSVKLKYDVAGWLWCLIHGPSRTKYKVKIHN